jgi:predicted DNA-binding transcriptional regulator AlpA
MDKKSKFLSQEGAAQIIGITSQCLNQWRHEGRDIPPYVKIGRIIRYPEDELYKWIEKKIHRPENIIDNNELNFKCLVDGFKNERIELIDRELVWINKAISWLEENDEIIVESKFLPCAHSFLRNIAEFLEYEKESTRTDIVEFLEDGEESTPT